MISSRLRFAAFAALTASCANTEQIPVALTLPDDIAACLSELRAELADPAPIHACINIRRTGASPYPCALELALDQLCPGGQCATNVSRWTAVCPAGMDAKLIEVDEGELLPADLELIDAATCPLPEQTPECNGSSVTVNSTGQCFARLDLQLQPGENSGTLVPAPAGEGLKLSYSGYFAEELKSGRDPQTLCSRIPARTATGASKTKVNATVTVSGSAPGTVTSAPVGKLACSTSRSPCAADVADGREYVLTAAADPDPLKDGRFKGWVSCPNPSNGSDPAKCTAVVRAGTSLEASFGYALAGEARASGTGATGTLTLESTGGETYSAHCTTEDASGCAEHIFTALEPIKLTAAPGPGSSVEQWIGCAAGPGVPECTLTMDASRSVAVVFARTGCGNGIVDAGEACDDGDLTSGDGCAADCTIEPGYRCDGVRSTCVGFSASARTITLDEGQSAGTTLQVVMNAAPSGPVSLSVASSDESIATVSPNILNFRPEDFSTAQTITVTPAPNTTDGPEQVSFTLTIAPDTIAGPLGMVDPLLISGTVNDDDGPPAISIAGVSLPEGNGGAATQFDFIVTLSNPSTYDVSVDYRALDGSAAAGTDYSLMPGTLHFVPGEVQKTITAGVTGDELREPDETFSVALSNPGFATLAGTGTALGTILNDDPLPVLSIAGPPRATEGPGATVDFIVSLSAASGEVVTADYATAGGSAVAGVDYLNAAGTLTFNPGEVSKTITVALVDDGNDEDDENFSVSLSQPANAALSPTGGTGVATIADDDPTPSVSIADPPAITEGNSSSRILEFTLSLSNGSERGVFIDCATSALTATPGTDYVERSATVTFAAGARTAIFPVTILGDRTDEPDETFRVTCSAPSHATLIAPGTATGTILDDDAPPAISLSCSPTVTEGNFGAAPASCLVLLSTPSARAISVDYATEAVTATSNVDYASERGTLTFAAGDEMETLLIGVLADLCNEADETFRVVLSAPVNATIPAGQEAATVTIVDNDPLPAITVANNSVTETDAGRDITLPITVTLTPASCRAVRVDYLTGAAGDTASAGTDYTATSGTLTIPAGSTSATIDVPVTGDNLDENDETFTLTLSAPTNATISGAATATGTILDNDGLPALSIADNMAVEGRDANLAFTVTLAPASGRAVTVHYATAPGTASAGADYTTTSGTLTIPAGATSGTINVPVIDDGVNEDDQTFTVTLSAPVNATISGPATATGRIADNDPPPLLGIANAEMTELDAGRIALIFSVSSGPTSERTITVDYATGAPGDTATAGVDYDAASGTLTLPPGSISATFIVFIRGDTLDEDDETFTVTLSNARNASIALGTARGTIRDNDPTPSVSIGNLTLGEPAGPVGSTASGNVPVTLSAASGRTVSVSWSTADSSATAPGDYTSASGTVTFPPGTTTQNISVTVRSDGVTEDFDEEFFVDLSSPTNATLASIQGTVTIPPNSRLRSDPRRVDARGDGESRAPAISRDGEVIAFESDASNLVEGDTNESADIFVYDRARKKIERASVSARGREANGASRRPAISGDGRWVVFESDASDLVERDTNGKTDIFVADRLTGTAERVSLTPAGGQSDQDSTDPNISVDGRYIVFCSAGEVLIHDRATRTTQAVGSTRGAEPSRAAISEGGRFVVFQSGPELMLHDAEGSTTILPLLALARGAPVMTPDGRFIAAAGSSIYDRTAGSTFRFDGTPSNHDTLAGISDDGRWVLSASDAEDGLSLVDRTAPKERELIRGGATREARLSGDGRHVVFVREGAIYLADRP